MRSFFFVLGVLLVLAFAFFWWKPDVRLGADVGNSSSASEGQKLSGEASKPPQITEAVPGDDATNVALSEQVTIAFSKPMKRDAVESAIHANFPYYLHWENDQEIRLEPVSLRPNEHYQYFISTLATDTDNLTLPEAVHVRFMTTADAPSSISRSVQPPVPSQPVTAGIPRAALPDDVLPGVIPTSKAPVVEGIVLEELSALENIPRYLVKILASDPEGAPLSYRWNVSCGLFSGGQNGQTVEWRTDAQGCPAAVLSVDVSDAVGASTTYVQRAF